MPFPFDDLFDDADDEDPRDHSALNNDSFDADDPDSFDPEEVDQVPHQLGIIPRGNCGTDPNLTVALYWERKAAAARAMAGEW